MTKTNGGELSLTLLRPSVWFEAHNAQVGSTIPISMPEMGAVGDAEVLSITSCPSITPGEGNVVTGKFIHHSNGNLLNVALEGSDEQIGVTDNHPYWSEDRKDYIPAGELRIGETVRTVHGLRRIGKILPRPRDEPVYNIEVHREHVYLVGSTGTLVHNSCPELPEGSFSISNWDDYPEGLERPSGPFKLLDGEEYNDARKAANRANSKIRRDSGLVGQDVDVHEIHPVKFGGSPTDPVNKEILDRAFHRQEVTPWWNRLQRNIENVIE